MKAERQKAMVQASRSSPISRTNRPPRLQHAAAAHTSAEPRSLSAPLVIHARRSASAKPRVLMLQAHGQDLEAAGVRLVPAQHAPAGMPAVCGTGPPKRRGNVDEADAATGVVA